jgi:hypothetical protein
MKRFVTSVRDRSHVWARFSLATIGVAAATCCVFVASANARTEGYRASVSGLPQVQGAGRTYLMRIDVRNVGRTVRPFCVDFTDDNGSWLIKMPALSSWDSDAFCLGTLRAGAHKVVRAYVTAAKTGSHTMSVTLGVAKVYRSLHRIMIDDKRALYWEQEFAIVG